MCYERFTALEETVSSDSERSGLGYQKTGDLITLPYTEVVHSQNPYATRTEKFFLFINQTGVGLIQLTPEERDEWFETEEAPDLIINVEGTTTMQFLLQMKTDWEQCGMHGKHNGLVLLDQELKPLVKEIRQ